jgi:hypothetical protein
VDHDIQTAQAGQSRLDDARPSARGDEVRLEHLSRRIAEVVTGGEPLEGRGIPIDDEEVAPRSSEPERAGGADPAGAGDQHPRATEPEPVVVHGFPVFHVALSSASSVGLSDSKIHWSKVSFIDRMLLPSGQKLNNTGTRLFLAE